MNMQNYNASLKKAIVYGRVSTSKKQDVKRQFINLEKFANAKGFKIEKYFSDSITGKSLTTEREGFTKMVTYIKDHSIDTLFISEISRIGRRVSSVTYTIEQLVEEHGVTIVVQHPREMTFASDENGNIDIIQKSMLMMLSLGAEMELHYQQARRLEGIEIAKKENKYKGRVAGSSYSNEQLLSRHSDIVNMLNHSTLPDTKIHEITGKGLSTVKRVKKILQTTQKAA